MVRGTAGAENGGVGAGRERWIGFTTFVVRSYQDILRHFVLTVAPAVVTAALYLG